MSPKLNLKMILTCGLYFSMDPSLLEYEGVGCILKYPSGKRTLISCILEFQCTNNTVEYESHIKGLKKEVVMKLKLINTFGD